MNNEIYYKVEGTLYRTKGKEKNLIKIDETFEDTSPIIAREKAFSHYQSYIDVLLQRKGTEYVSHKKTVVELTDFFASGRKHKLLPDLVDMDSTSLSIYMVKKTPEVFQNALGETDYQNRWRIHYIDNQSEDWSAYVLKSLMYEYLTYEKNGFDCKNYVVTYDTLDYFKKRSIQRILETPRFINYLSKQ
jgi:hypothetical protein